MLPAYGVRRIALVNWEGVRTLYFKEVRRFMKVYTQTLAAPAVTTLLFLAIFVVALGGGARAGGPPRLMLGVHLPEFIAPGLIVMAMLQNAFANSSSSLIIGKVQGSIIDVLLPPLAAGELVAAFVGGAVTRAILVGLTVWFAVWLLPGVDVPILHFWAILYFGLLGATMMALLGLLTGVWAEKFDHTAAITNFIVQPLSMLSGTFYTVGRLAAPWALISQFNPVFHVIDGFRYGFIGQSDAPLSTAALALLAINILLWVVAVRLIRRGWRLTA